MYLIEHIVYRTVQKKMAARTRETDGDGGGLWDTRDERTHERHLL